MTSLYVNGKHIAEAEKLVEESRLNGGLAPVDTDRFWADQEIAFADPFSPDCPQVSLGVLMSDECIAEETGVKTDDFKLFNDPLYRVPLAKLYNDRSEKIVGKRLLSEKEVDPATLVDEPPTLADIFEAKREWRGWSWWLLEAASDPDSLRALLDRVEKRLEDLKPFVIKEPWLEKARRAVKAGGKMPLYRHQRGPVTFATSVYGAEKFIFLLYDEPDLAARLRDLIKRAMLERARVMEEAAGYALETVPRGFSFADDNCALLNKELYDFWAKPILKAVFERYSPDPKDLRYQHSDSDMAQHLETLGELGLNACNFGPRLTVAQIREKIPRAVIHGQLAPFTFSRNEEVGIAAEFLRDFDQAREKRGLHFSTAGSINSGSRLTGMRLIMAAIQRLGRY